MSVEELTDRNSTLDAVCTCDEPGDLSICSPNVVLLFWDPSRVPVCVRVVTVVVVDLSENSGFHTASFVW